MHARFWFDSLLRRAVEWGFAVARVTSSEMQPSASSLRRAE